MRKTSQLRENKIGEARCTDRKVWKYVQSFSYKPERMRLLGRPRCRWEENIKTDLKYVKI